MLNEKQQEELKDHLERAQNPLFFYDNDADGLCSFLLLRRAYGKGKGVAIRSYPELNKSYAAKARELKADYVFVLDKPVIASEFFQEIHEMGLPLVWVDHHDMPFENKWDNLQIYNSTREGKGNEPVTFVCYEITKRKEDMWLAVSGCIADHYLPYFASEFGEKYPELWGKNIKKPFDVYYKTEIGKIAQNFNFGIKDSTTHIVQMQNFLISCKSPGDVISEEKENTSFRKRFDEIRKKYNALIERAEKCVEDKMVWFEYSGDLSISSEISNEIRYKHPDKLVVIVYKKGAISNISIRGRGVKKILEKVIVDFPGASGGGHEDAVGARIKTGDLTKFKNYLLGEL